MKSISKWIKELFADILEALKNMGAEIGANLS
jgi:hypothetical protein